MKKSNKKYLPENSSKPKDLHGMDLFLEKIMNFLDLGIIAKLLVFSVILALIFFVFAVIYGFFINGIKGREFSGVGFNYGADPLYDKYVDSTCDVRISEAISSLPTPTTIETTKTTLTRESKPTDRPSPSPTSQNTPTPYLLSEEEPAWDFNAGLISKNWKYWVPEFLNGQVEGIPENCNNEDIPCEGWDLTWFGIEAINGEGLIMSKNEYDTGGPPFEVGLSRIFPDGKDKLQIQFVWEEFDTDNENPDDLKFLIGFIDSQNTRNNGSFIEFYYNNGLSNPNLRRLDGSDYNNYIGFSSYTDNRTIFIDCDLDGKLSAKCTFYIDGDNKKTQTRDIQFPNKWDSLYIGYQLPDEGSIKMKLDSLKVFTEN